MNAPNLRKRGPSERAKQKRLIESFCQWCSSEADPHSADWSRLAFNLSGQKLAHYNYRSRFSASDWRRIFEKKVLLRKLFLGNSPEIVSLENLSVTPMQKAISRNPRIHVLQNRETLSAKLFFRRKLFPKANATNPLSG